MARVGFKAPPELSNGVYLLMRFNYYLYGILRPGNKLKTFGCLLEAKTVGNHIFQIDAAVCYEFY